MNINELIGKTITKIKNNGVEIDFYTSNNEHYRMYHSQDCCESVYVDDIVGGFDDLLNSPLTMAEEVGNDEPAKDKWDESYTWTFYKLATVKGYVTIKWYGTSNGYYSESVYFVLVGSKEDDSRNAY